MPFTVNSRRLKSITSREILLRRLTFDLDLLFSISLLCDAAMLSVILIIRLIKPLGEGQFGKVHQGEWTVPGAKIKVDVAIKTLKEGSGEQDKVKFLQEAAIMGQFTHPNVVQLYGVITQGEPVSFVYFSLMVHFQVVLFSNDKYYCCLSQVMLVLELLPGGDLREMLRDVRLG